VVRSASAAKYKQFREGLDQLLEEGVVQGFETDQTGQNTALLGAVGQLQFDVVLYRLQTEYNADPKMEPAPYKLVRWFDPDMTMERLRGETLGTGMKLATDLKGRPVVLFPSQWSHDYFVKEHPKLHLHAMAK
jgi:peptide chain release factor 3